MRHIAYWILSLCLLTGCYPSIKPQLEEAEALLTENPDSAYQFLQTIEQPERHSKAEYATWCLLTTQAADKSYREHTSDSLIQVAVRYFSRQHNPDRLATALYTQGRVEKELGKNEEAAQSFVKALDVAKGGEDYKLQFLASSHLGTLYAYSHLDSLAFSAYEQALHFAELSGDSVNLAYAYAYLGRVYGLREEWDKATDAYAHSIEISEKISSIPALSLGLNELSAIYSHANRYQDAFDCLQRVLDLPDSPSPNDQAATYLSMGDLLRLMGNYDLAVTYLEKAQEAANLYTKRGIYQCLSYLYEEKEEYEKSVKYNELFWQYNDSIQEIEQRKAIIAVERKYNNEKLIFEKQQLKLRNTKYLMIGSTLFFLIIGFFLFIYARKQHIIVSLLKALNKIKGEIEEKEHQLVQCQQEIAALSQQLSDYEGWQQSQQQVETEIDKLAQQVEKLKEQKTQILIQLNLKKEEMERLENQLEQIKKAPDLFARIAETKKIDEMVWPELIDKMDVTHRQFTKRLQAAYPKLQKADIRYCILWKLGYTKNTIIKLMNISEDNYHKRHQRIRARIDNTKKWEKGELEQFIQLF